MQEAWKQILSSIEQSPQRSDLIAGFVSLCRTLQNQTEQATLLVECSKVLLANQPLLALRLLELALQVAPRNPSALEFARELFKRRGRWASEHRVAEFMATQSHATSATWLPQEVSRTIAIAEVNTAGSIPPQNPATSEGAESFENPQAVEERNELVAAPEPEVAPSVPAPIENPASPQNRNEANLRVKEFLARCGFDATWSNFGAGFSDSNAGLVSFVGMLTSLSLISASDLPLATGMLRKMINEKPDDSGAQELLERFFSDSGSATSGRR